MEGTGEEATDWNQQQDVATSRKLGNACPRGPEINPCPFISPEPSSLEQTLIEINLVKAIFILQFFKSKHKLALMWFVACPLRGRCLLGFCHGGLKAKQNQKNSLIHAFTRKCPYSRYNYKRNRCCSAVLAIPGVGIATVIVTKRPHSSRGHFNNTPKSSKIQWFWSQQKVPGKCLIFFLLISKTWEATHAVFIVSGDTQEVDGENFSILNIWNRTTSFIFS